MIPYNITSALGWSLRIREKYVKFITWFSRVGITNLLFRICSDRLFNCRKSETWVKKILKLILVSTPDIYFRKFTIVMF